MGGYNGTVVDDLVPPDKLTFQVDDGEPEELTTSCPKKNTFCTGNIAEKIAGKALTFAFDRDDEDENALDSNVKMPAAFEVATEVDDLVRGEALPIDVTGSSSGLRWEVGGECIWDASGTLSGGEIPAEAFDSPDSEEADNCEVTVTFTRETTGDVDPNFGKGGEITAIQERKFTVFTLAAGSVVSPGNSSDASTSSDLEDAATSAADAGDASPADEAHDAGTSDAAPADDVPDAAGTDSSAALGSSQIDGGADAGDAGDAG